MKLLIIICLLLALAAGGFWYFEPQKAGDLIGGAPSAARVYKWKDVQGTWHITDNPPAPGVEYEIREYRSDLNVLPLPSPK